MDSIEYIPGGFRIRHNGQTQFMWTTADLPAAVKNGTALEIQDWMNSNLRDLIGMYVQVRVDELNPFRFRMMVSVSPIPPGYLDRNMTTDPESGGGG